MTVSLRAVVVWAVAVLLTSAAGCDTDAEPPSFPRITVPGVLPVGSLPQTPSAAEEVEAAVGAGLRCAGMVSGGKSLDDFASRWQIVAYRDVGGDDVTSGAYAGYDFRDHPRDVLTYMRSTFRKHCSPSKDDIDVFGIPSEITGLPPNQFAYRIIGGSFSHSEVVQAFGMRGDTLVQVVVYHDGPGKPSVSATDLLTRAMRSVPRN